MMLSNRRRMPSPRIYGSAAYAGGLIHINFGVEPHRSEPRQQRQPPAYVFRTEYRPGAEPPAPASVTRTARQSEIQAHATKLKTMNRKSDEGK